MFYCKRCGDKRGWPDSFLKSSGRCECCGKSAVCSDVPSSALPWPETMPAEKIAEIEAEIERIDQWDMLNSKYFLSKNGEEREVTMAEWVSAERAAGFHNTSGYPDRPATGGFSNGNIKGRREYLSAEKG